MVALSMWALCPTTQRAPMIVAWIAVQWMIVPSWMLVYSPTVM